MPLAVSGMGSSLGDLLADLGIEPCTGGSDVRMDEGHGTVILDDLKARRIAHTLGISVTGTLGIVLQAKKAGQLPSVSAAIKKLEQRGMWIAPAVSAKAIHLADE